MTKDELKRKILEEIEAAVQHAVSYQNHGTAGGLSKAAEIVKKVFEEDEVDGDT